MNTEDTIEYLTQEITQIIKKLPLLDDFLKNKGRIYGGFLRFILETYFQEHRIPRMDEIYDYITEGHDIDLSTKYNFGDFFRKIIDLGGTIEYSFSEYHNVNLLPDIPIKNIGRHSFNFGVYMIWIPVDNGRYIHYDLLIDRNTGGFDYGKDYNINTLEFGYYFKKNIYYLNHIRGLRIGFFEELFNSFRNKKIDIMARGPCFFIRYGMCGKIGLKRFYRLRKYWEKGYRFPNLYECEDKYIDIKSLIQDIIKESLRIEDNPIEEDKVNSRFKYYIGNVYVFTGDLSKPSNPADGFIRQTKHTFELLTVQKVMSDPIIGKITEYYGIDNPWYIEYIHRPGNEGATKAQKHFDSLKS